MMLAVREAEFGAPGGQPRPSVIKGDAPFDRETLGFAGVAVAPVLCALVSGVGPDCGGGAARVSRFLRPARDGGDVRMVRGEPSIGTPALNVAACSAGLDDKPGKNTWPRVLAATADGDFGAAHLHAAAETSPRTPGQHGVDAITADADLRARAAR